MRTATNIANMAADLLDADPIGDIRTDRSSLSRNYHEAAQTVISEFPWNCTTTRAELFEAHAGTQVPDHSKVRYTYTYPRNALNLIDINDRPVKDVWHEIETLVTLDQAGNETGSQNVIVCSEPQPIMIRYTRMIDPSAMDPHLAFAIAIELAIRCCNKLANSSSKLEMLREMYSERTQGDGNRVGGHQIDSREGRSEPRRSPLGTSGNARHGISTW